MDKGTLIFLAIFLSVVVAVISSVFPKEDRIKVALISAAFIGIFPALYFWFWLMGLFYPEGDWGVKVLGFLLYGALLEGFRLLVLKLHPAENENNK